MSESEYRHKCPNCGTSEAPDYRTVFCKLNDSELGELYEDELNIKLCLKCHYWELA